MKTQMFGKRMGIETQPDTFAVKLSDGSVDVFRGDGVWLGWADSSGAVMSTANPDRRELGHLVYNAAQVARHV